MIKIGDKVYRLYDYGDSFYGTFIVSDTVRAIGVDEVFLDYRCDFEDIKELKMSLEEAKAQVTVASNQEWNYIKGQLGDDDFDEEWILVKKPLTKEERLKEHKQKMEQLEKEFQDSEKVLDAFFGTKEEV